MRDEVYRLPDVDPHDTKRCRSYRGLEHSGTDAVLTHLPRIQRARPIAGDMPFAGSVIPTAHDVRMGRLHNRNRRGFRISQAPRASLFIRMDAERDGAIPLVELAQIARYVQESVDRIARSLSGRDHPGRPPEDLRRLSRLEAVAIQPGSAILEIEAPGDTESFPIDFDNEDAGVQAIETFVAAVDAMSRNQPLPPAVTGTAADSVVSFVRSLRAHETVSLRASARGFERSAAINPVAVAEREAQAVEPAGVTSTVVGRLYGVNLDTHTYRVRDELGRSHLVFIVEEMDVRRTAQALLGDTVRVNGELRVADGKERIAATDIQRVDSIGAPDYRSWSLEHALGQVVPVASIAEMAIEDLGDDEFDAFWRAANEGS